MGLIDNIKRNRLVKLAQNKPFQFFTKIKNKEITNIDKELLEIFLSNISLDISLDDLISTLLSLGIKSDYLLLESPIKERLIKYIVSHLQYDTRKNEIINQLIKENSNNIEIKETIKYHLSQQKPLEEIKENIINRLSNRYNSKEDQASLIDVISLLNEIGVEFDEKYIVEQATKNSQLQAVLSENGLLTPSIVSKMYRYRFEAQRQWAITTKYKDDVNYPNYYIDPSLEVLDTDEFTKYWRKMDSITGLQDCLLEIIIFHKRSGFLDEKDFFTLRNVEEMYQEWFKKYGESYGFTRKDFFADFDSIRGAMLTKDGLPTAYLFKSNEYTTILRYIISYNWEGNPNKYKPELMKFLCANIDKIPEEYRNILKKWDELGKGKTPEEAYSIQKEFWTVATDSHNIYENYFASDGTITEKFYKAAIQVEKWLDLLVKIDPNWQTHYTKEERTYIEYAKKYPNFRYLFPKHYHHDIHQMISEIITDGKLNREAVISLLIPYDKNKRTVLSNEPDSLYLLSKTELEYFNLTQKHPTNSNLLSITLEQIEYYFDSQGSKNELTKLLFYNFDLELLELEKDYLKVNERLSEKELLILNEYKNVPTNLRGTYKEYIKNNIDTIEIPKIKFIVELLQRISLSNAIELSAHVNSLAKLLLDTDNPLEALEKIEDVFLKNNLPEVAKLFLTFQILHPDDKMINDFDIRNSEKISPILRKNSHSLDRLKTIIFSDLLRSAIYSNNRSLKEYIKSIEVGNKLFLAIKENKLSIENLSKEELDILEKFKAHLETIYINSKKNELSPLTLTGNLKEDLIIISNAYEPTELYDLPDRITRMFTYALGIKSFEELKTIIYETASKVDEFNRTKREFTLEKGDFIKGIGNVNYLNQILQNGSVSKEFLGESAGSDLTPLDTDLSIVLEDNLTIEEAISKSISKGYGPIWFVLKNDERFNITRDNTSMKEENLYDRKSIEVFRTLDDGHYGIRTGFPSSFIDYIVVEKEDKRIYLEIVKNGFYIPVVDKSGNLLFKPQDYDLLKDKMQGLTYYGSYDYTYAKADMLQTEEILDIASQLDKSNEDIKAKKESIYNKLKLAIESVGLKLKNTIDGDLTEGYVELIDTGSTGRGTNALYDGDFDLMMRLDSKLMASPERLSQLKNAISKAFNYDGQEIGTGDFRWKNVKLDELNVEVDIDISFVTKTNKVKYSSDESLRDRLRTMYKVDPIKYKLAIANIIYAKKVLKQAGAYKPNRGETPQGGLGGIGVENWILQNGGSFELAARKFLKLAEGKDYEEFKTQFQVWDFGENHFAQRNNRYVHDDFVYNNMSKEGYEKMKIALAEYLMTLEAQKSNENSINFGL